MSIEIMTRVWKYSKANSGYLLVLLAIADHADDEGYAYPSIKGIALKSRLGARQVHHATRHLRDMGELSIGYKQGPNGKNMYQVLTRQPCHDCKEHGIAPTVQNLHSVSDDTEDDEHDVPDSTVQNLHGANVSTVRVGAPKSSVFVVSSLLVEPSYKKDSLSSTDVDAQEPVIPKIHDLLEAWDKICVLHGHLPVKRIVSDKLKAKLRARLKEHPSDEFWEVVFNKCVDSPFLSGKKTDWRVTLDWLVKNAENSIRVYEGHYDAKEFSQRA